MLAALATLSFTIENLFPPLILPGAKLGVSNIFILFALVALGAPYAFATLAVKVILGSLFAGNLSAITYSLPAGVIALSAEFAITYFIKKTSIVATSVVGSVLNITTQNIIFCLITDTAEYLCYLPYLALIGISSGLIVGFAIFFLLKALPLKN